MNKERRGSLKEATALLDQAADIITVARDDEQYCLDNLPENLQNSERYENMEKAVDDLEEALDRIDDVKSCISEAVA